MAAFAAEGVEDYTDKSHILKNMNTLTEGEAEDLVRVTPDEKYNYRKQDGKMVRIEPNTEVTVATKEEYLSFLRSVKGSKYESIQGRVDMLKAYAVFGPSIAKLKSELKDLEKIKEHPNYLGSGSNSGVFAIEFEGKRYAVRMPGHKTDTVVSPGTVDSHINGAILGRSVPHLEQIVAASYEDGVTVAEMMHGKEVSDLEVDDIQKITDSQLEDLFATLKIASERGIEIDPKPSNFFYDETEGFGIVDYCSSKEKGKSSADRDLGMIVGWMETPISNAGLYGCKSPETIEEYAQALEKHKANLDVLKRYREIVIKSMEGSEHLQKALKEIDKRIKSNEETITNYSNPEFASQQITKDQEWEKKKGKFKSNMSIENPYNKASSENKAPSGEGKVEERIVREIPKYLPDGGTVLDLGAGKGNDTLFLAEQGFAVTAWDIAQDNVDELDRLAKEKELSIQTEARDIRTLSSLGPDHHFDVFVSTYVLHNLSRQDALLLVKEIQERTNIDGLNVIAAFTEDGDFYRNAPNTEKFYLQENELKDLYIDAGWDIREYREVRVGAEKKRPDGSPMINVSAKLIARKKEH